MIFKLLFHRESRSLNDIIGVRSMCQRKEGGVALHGDAGVLGPLPNRSGPLDVLRL